MKFYQEITLLPDPEIASYFIWKNIYTQLHIALADIKNKYGIERIGVSFPEYYYEEKHDNNGKLKSFGSLGSKLRVFAPEETDLLVLDLQKWLAKLTDYVHIKPIKSVPNVTGYVTVRRYRTKDSEQVINEFAKFKNISLADARTHCEKHKKPIRQHPYVTLKSQTNQIDYRLSICQEATETAVAGNFTVYGMNTMSHSVTVPHW